MHGGAAGSGDASVFKVKYAAAMRNNGLDIGAWIVAGISIR